MISIGKVTSVEQVVRYLVEARTDAAVEYYANGREVPGRWTGRAAQRLDLNGEVSAAQLRALLSGHHPRSGADLLQRRWAKQSVVAFDVTFSAPKSVTLLWALGDENTRAAVLRAQQAAVDSVAEYLQRHAGWGRCYDREEGDVVPVRAELAVAQFLHRTSRPVTDPASGAITVDPQLHTHLLIPNVVRRDDCSWGQLHGVALYRHAASAGAVGQAVLRHQLVRELGVEVEVSPNGCFEVRGISRSQRQEFSRRSRQVAAMDATYGVDSWYGHKLAVLASREGKDEIPAGHDVIAAWRERAATVHLDGRVVASLLQRQQLAPHRALAALDVGDLHALLGEQGMTADAATFARRDLVRAVAAHAPQGMSLADLEATVDAVLADRSNVVDVGVVKPQLADVLPARVRAYFEEDRRYSTPEMVAIEERMLETARAGRTAGRGLAGETDVVRAIAARPGLTAEQETMIRAVCRRGEAVSLVEGSAGSGKTTALDVCREALEASGREVVGAALSAKAARKLTEEAGIPATTVHSLLRRLEGGAQPPDSVVVIDEAAMVGSRHVARLVDYAARDQSKLVLVGDRHQLQPIDGGAAFRALGDHLGRVVLSENVRQADAWERRALADLRAGRVAEAVSAYVAHEAITTVAPEHADGLRGAILLDYQSAVAQGRDTIMLAQRRADVAFLNRCAHEHAAHLGRLQGPEINVGTYRPASDGEVQLPKRFRAGDLALCLDNDRQRGLANGMRVDVIAVDPSTNSMTLRTPEQREVTIDTRQYDALDHGYAMTVHKAQGLTADVALVLATGEEGREWTYTAMSRGREANCYYTLAAEPTVDSLGDAHEETERELERRLSRAWSRSTAADSTLDYERRAERLPAARPQFTPDRALEPQIAYDPLPAYSPAISTGPSTLR